MTDFCFPENCKIIQGLEPIVGPNGVLNSVPISLKYAHMVWAIVDVNTAGTSAAVAIVPQTDELVAFGSPAALAVATQIWANQDTATNDRLVEQTDAVNFTTTADANHKQVIIQINPAALGTSEDCFRIQLTTVAATDYVAITYVVQPRYPSSAASSPSMIVD